MTKNRVLDELRSAERRPRAVVALEDIPPLEVLDAPFERLEAIDAVWRAVGHLNVDLKMALLLRDVVGLPTRRSNSLEITLATVKWRIYKAREEVQLALAREGIRLGAAGLEHDTAPAAPAARQCARSRRSQFASLRCVLGRGRAVRDRLHLFWLLRLLVRSSVAAAVRRERDGADHGEGSSTTTRPTATHVAGAAAVHGARAAEPSSPLRLAHLRRVGRRTRPHSPAGRPGRPGGHARSHSGDLPERGTEARAPRVRRRLDVGEESTRQGRSPVRSSCSTTPSA